MVKFYLNQIEQGKITILDVPPKWKAGVEKEMKHGGEKENDISA